MRRCRASSLGTGGCPLHDVCRRTAAALLRSAMLPINPVVDCIVEELQYGMADPVYIVAVSKSEH